MSDWPTDILDRESRIFNVEKPPYNAIPDAYYTDGVATNASTTFTSATANFTSADVGKVIVILKASWSEFEDHHTTISSVTNSTTVELAEACHRNQNPTKFYISRGGNQNTAIQAAIDAAAAAGGGRVYLPGVGYLIDGLVNKHRVYIEGSTPRSCFVHQSADANRPIVRKDTTSNNSAYFTGLRNLWLDGNRRFQTVDSTSTLNGAYTAGNTTITLTSGTNFLAGGGKVKIGTNILKYSAKNGNQLTGVEGGQEGSTDANQSNGATVTQVCSIGIHMGVDPPSTNPTGLESQDPIDLVENVFVKNVKGDGYQGMGWSEHRLRNVTVAFTDDCGFKPSWDTFMESCTAFLCGRIGFAIWQAEAKLSNCKAFYCGNNVAAEGWGFLLEGPANPEEGGRILATCSAQDNKADGFRLRNCQRSIVQGISSSNGTSSVGTYTGIKLDGISSLNIIDVACTERVASPNNSQRNALSIDSTSVSNIIRLTHGATGGSAVLTALKAGSIVAGNDLAINGLPINTRDSATLAGDLPFTAQAFNDITGLSFAVAANGIYRFRAVVYFQTSVTTTAAQLGINGPTLTKLTMRSSKQIGVGATESTDMFQDAIITAYNTADPASTAEPSQTTDLVYNLEGIIQCSAAGTVILRMAKDVAAGTITVKAGSHIEFQRVDILNV
jgi:hypothetical protein